MTRRPRHGGAEILALACCSVAFLTHTTFAASPASHGDRSTVIVRVEEGLHWLDAAIGAATTVAVALLVFGLALIVRHTNRSCGTELTHGTKGAKRWSLLVLFERSGLPAAAWLSCA